MTIRCLTVCSGDPYLIEATPSSDPRHDLEAVSFTPVRVSNQIGSAVFTI
jgi:hypothetical protein